MSEENVDLIMDGFHRFVAGALDIEKRWHENGVLTGPEGWPEQGPFKGHEAIRGQFERLGADYAEFHIADIEVVAERGEWVVIRFTWRTRGRASGIETAAEMAAALRVKDGRILEGHYRWQAEDALEAAGLSE